jgi:integrase
VERGEGGWQARERVRAGGWIDEVQSAPWLDASGHTAGPLFRRLNRHDELTELAMSDRAVARIVKGAAAAIGLDPRDYSGHSLRAGFLTEAAHARATIPKMQDVSRHKTVAILLDYVRSAEMYDDHAGANFL